jgi:L-lactate dehydrogenase (cytochrome)
MPVITNIEDLRRIYERRTPRMFYDYAESGSWTEQTFRENTSDFSHIRLKQRVAVDMSGRSTKSQMIGEDVAMPVALAPVGLTGMQSADGEIKAARAAENSACPTLCPPCRSARSRMWRRIQQSLSGFRFTR